MNQLGHPTVSVETNADMLHSAQRRANNRVLSADLAAWIVALSLVGYPMLGTLVAFTALPSLAASIPVRASIIIFSLMLMLRSKVVVTKHLRFQVIILFWSLYFVRLVWDMFVARIPVAGDFMFNFIFFSIVPAVALMHAREINERRLTDLLFVYGSVTCVLATLAYFTDLAISRSFTEEAEGRLVLDTVNPITYGHVGVTTLLAALSKSRRCTSAMDWVSVAAASALGLLAIQLSGSRGPLMSLLICILALACFNKAYRWMLLPFFALILLFFAGAFDESGNLLASRLTSSVQSDNSEVRIIMQAGAIQQFLDSPVFGSAIVERQFQDYPHNLFVESAMAMGVIGLVLIIGISIFLLRGVAQKIKGWSLLLALIALQYFSAAQFSGSISASSPFWVLVALVAPGRKTQAQRKSSVGRSMVRSQDLDLA
jgi:O-antigen ligase